MVNTSVRLGSMQLDNPVIPASGTFGFGYEFAELYDINILGSISLKGTTLEPRFGNPTPRIAECTAGLINSVGLQNPGIDQVLSREIPELEKHYKKPVIANISGFSVDEYVKCCEEADSCDKIGMIELNISCPNVHNGGMSFGTSVESAFQVTKAVKAATKKQIFVKLTPNAPNIAEIAAACESAGADGISLINTLLGMRIDLKRRRPVIANVKGGFSGPAVFPVALRMVYEVYEAVRIPIMGMGGVSTAADVIEMMLAGATAVQVGAANLKDPFACKSIIESLPEEMEKLGIDDLSKIIGGAH